VGGAPAPLSGPALFPGGRVQILASQPGSLFKRNYVKEKSYSEIMCKRSMTYERNRQVLIPEVGGQLLCSAIRNSATSGTRKLIADYRFNPLSG
jgi:hypothetical protein